RPIALRPDNHLYREPEIETKPQQTWTAVFDAVGGLAVISSGLLESAVLDLPERPIALTLFRATRRTVGTDGEPAGQLQGELRFRYWLVPLTGEPDRVELSRLGQRLEGGLRAAILTAEDQIQHRVQTGDPYGDPAWRPVKLPPTAGFLSVTGPAVVTSLRQAGDGLELRMFNPNVVAGEAVITLGNWPGAAIAYAQPVNFEGAPTGKRLTFVDGQVAVKLGAKKIVTLRLE
ncbi:MAG: glycoside hydrolase family 38, partial [Bryobacteraceae bacterium]